MVVQNMCLMRFQFKRFSGLEAGPGDGRTDMQTDYF